MEDVAVLVVTGAFWASCLGFGCLLGVWFQGKISALCRAITNDREMIGKLQKRVEELESKFVIATSGTPEGDWSKAEWIDMKDIYNSVDTDFLNENVVNLNDNN